MEQTKHLNGSGLHPIGDNIRDDDELPRAGHTPGPPHRRMNSQTPGGIQNPQHFTLSDIGVVMRDVRVQMVEVIGSGLEPPHLHRGLVMPA